MPSRKTGAIAVFVKTPGLSPIKTRLAASIGSSAAEWFHILSAKAVKSVVPLGRAEDGGFYPYSVGTTASELFMSFLNSWMSILRMIWQSFFRPVPEI